MHFLRLHGAARRAMRRPGRRACGPSRSWRRRRLLRRLDPRTPSAAPPPRGRSSAAPAASRSPSLDRSVPLDRVIAIVNDEALTQWDVNEQKRVVLGQMKAANVTPPSADVLEKQLLERLITERVLLQYAKDTGIRVDDTQVERALARIAEDNKLSAEDFRKAVEREGIPFAKYRSDIRNEITVQRLREREVEGRVSVSDAEVDHLLATQEAQAGGEVEYRLAHILVLVPEQASPDQIDVRQRRAETALAQVRSGTDFAQVAAGFSDAPDALSRRQPRLAHAGAAADGVRRPGAADEARRRVARAALGERLSHREAARDEQPQLADGHRADAPSPHPDQGERDHVERRGEAQDRAHPRADRAGREVRGSGEGQLGGRERREGRRSRLGVAGRHGARLRAGDESPQARASSPAPVRTPFGWHLIQVQERRTQDITREQAREQARQALRQRKSDEAFQEWVRQTRDRSYVEIRVDER